MSRKSELQSGSLLGWECNNIIQYQRQRRKDVGTSFLPYSQISGFQEAKMANIDPTLVPGYLEGKSYLHATSQQLVTKLLSP
jgi:hypothetical protein